MNPLPILVWTIGPSGAGKSTFLKVAAKYPSTEFLPGVVSVGALMRAKYPPEHFQGKGNPAHTANEAWELFLSETARLAAERHNLIFVDGQPRDMTQLALALALPHPMLFLHLWAGRAIREERIRHRDGSDAARLALDLARLDNDRSDLYDIVSALGAMSNSAALLWSYDTGSPRFSAPDIMDNLCRAMMSR